MQDKLLGIGGKQNQSSESCGADGIALGNCLGGVADSVEGVGDGTDGIVHFRHFGNAAGVVGDRAVGVNSDNHAGHGQHGHCGNADAIESGKSVGKADGQADCKHRGRGGLQAYRKTRDDVGAVPGGGGFGNPLNRFVGAGIVLRDHNNDNGQDQADQCRVKQVDGRDAVHFGHDVGGYKVEGNGGKDGGPEHAFVQSAHDVFTFAHPDKEGSDNGGDNGNRAQQKREVNGHGVSCKDQGSQQHGGNDSYRVGLEKVGCHAGTVANIVPYVVSDGCRVARVVLGDTGFNFANQVGADVSALRKNTAAEPGKNGNQTAAEAQGHQGNHLVNQRHVLRAGAGHVGEVAGNGGQGKTGHQHAGNRAAFEGQAQPRGQPFFTGFRHPEIGQHGNPHSDIAGEIGGYSPYQKAYGRFGSQSQKNEHEDNDADDRHAFELAVQVGDGAFLDGVGDFDHFGIAFRSILDGSGHDQRVRNSNKTNKCATQRDIIQYPFHVNPPLTNQLKKHTLEIR